MRKNERIERVGRIWKIAARFRSVRTLYRIGAAGLPAAGGRLRLALESVAFDHREAQ